MSWYTDMLYPTQAQMRNATYSSGIRLQELVPLAMRDIVGDKVIISDHPQWSDEFKNALKQCYDCPQYGLDLSAKLQRWKKIKKPRIAK